MNCRVFATLLVFVPAAGLAADSVALTLSEAVKLAIAQNRTVKLARLKVQEKQEEKSSAKADYFPRLKNESSFVHVTSLENIELPRGAFGAFPNSVVVPSHDVVIGQGDLTAETIGTSLTQPLTPLIRIRQEHRVAASVVVASREDVKKLQNQVAVKVHEAYYGILIAQLQKDAAEQDRAYANSRLMEAQQGVRDGSALNVDVLDGKAALLQSEQSVLTIDLRLADLKAELNDLLGLPLDTQLILSPVQVNTPTELSREELFKIAFETNPEITSGMETVKQAKAAVASAKSGYIPDIAVFAKQSYQNGVPFLVHNFGTFGFVMNYDVFDFGKRRSLVRQRETQLAHAQENLERLKESVAVEIEQSANKVERTRNLLQVASEVVRLRTESERVAENQLKQGVVLVSTRRAASAASYKAQADLLQAQLAYMLAQAELQQTVGRTPGE
ncbi:MAG: TolC family protein [Acidobacteriaceae bacterium]|nr:TolC family protein [Acidobacteriaceae bacterium]